MSKDQKLTATLLFNFGDCVVRTHIGNWFHAKAQSKRKVAKITLRLCGNLAALRETLF